MAARVRVCPPPPRRHRQLPFLSRLSHQSHPSHSPNNRFLSDSGTSNAQHRPSYSCSAPSLSKLQGPEKSGAELQSVSLRSKSRRDV